MQEQKVGFGEYYGMNGDVAINHCAFEVMGCSHRDVWVSRGGAYK